MTCKAKMSFLLLVAFLGQAVNSVPPPVEVAPAKNLAPGYAKCDGEVPFYPEPGKYRPLALPVDDPNLGVVIRKFGIHIPEEYSPDKKTPMIMHFHGSGGQGSNSCPHNWCDISDEDADGGFIVVGPDGVDNVWNVSATDGPMGPTCVLPRPPSHPARCDVYESCNIYYDVPEDCDYVEQNTCDWRNCYDDTAFVRAIYDYVRSHYCIDVNSVHMSGSSNGGMFVYANTDKLNDIIASFGPVVADPVVGYPKSPPLDPPVSIIDFAGLLDETIPYDLDSPGTHGEGPHSTVISSWYSYLDQKPNVVQRYKNEMGCTTHGDYPTEMDDAEEWDGFSCEIWSDCLEGNEFVSCVGNFEHGWPYTHTHPETGINVTRILWDFMKRHRREGN